ncbi:sulfate reduction electron transfer complex DsrMKJOP subunit DsrP [Candidatus Magnetomonas plexicatena]|uniref:sulfate reduction electron transfer complex DsrMKJOP subunit DsrP n=1 Tax=Candidatus Magnetomonas plexicatena TaxID=2552947 RepID=UPI0011003C68|nr:polysulfide reductase NrfD [Nitrospirales bacterium LBB_01]
MTLLQFIRDWMRHLTRGNKTYFVWLGLLSIAMLNAMVSYIMQLDRGLIVTNMRDQISWGFYISNFTFLVGVAAAAVILVIPSYIYHFKPIKEIALFGEMVAVTAVMMCLLFIMVDLGKPLASWHLFITPNFPRSILMWDVIVLNGYLILNTLAVCYVLYCAAHGREYKMIIMWPLVLVSIPWAFSIHTVTAFLYNGLSSRPFWNASIIAPRFIASAMCSGPSLMILMFQVARKVSDIEVNDKAIFKIAELIAYAMGFNLFLYGAELFKEFYSQSIHLAPVEYLFFGLKEHTLLVPFTWTALVFNLTGFIIFLSPRLRNRFLFLNIACVLVFIGVYIEKGMGFVIPGFVPDTLGEIYDYLPSYTELSISAGIWAFGAFFYTLLLKTAIPIYKGELSFLSHNMRHNLRDFHKPAAH